MLYNWFYVGVFVVDVGGPTYNPTEFQYWKRVSTIEKYLFGAYYSNYLAEPIL
jgi:hypothetical protein